MTRLRPALPYLALVAIAVGMGNFFWSLFESMAIGGDALNGYQAGGHFYVGSHGSYTEVSPQTWEWSRLHGLSQFVTFPLMMLGMATLVAARAFNGSTAGAPAQTRVRVQAVLSSGARLAEWRGAVHLGEVKLNGPFVSVSVYPGGVILKPLIMGSRAILASEIQGVVPRPARMGGSIELRHRAADVGMPVRLFADPESRLGRALQSMYYAAETAPPMEHAADPTSPVLDRGGSTPQLVTLGMNVLGVVVFGALIYLGITQVLPSSGPFGLVWFAGLIAIGVLNLRRWRANRGGHL